MRLPAMKNDPLVKRRYVYHLAGYEPGDAPAQYRRFVRQLAVFQHTWNVDTTLSYPEQSAEQSRAKWTVGSRAVNWQVELDYEVLLWDDIVRADLARRLPVRLLKAAVTYLDFFATGTIFRYLTANPHYAIFSVFPLFALALFVAGAWLAALQLIGLLDLAGISKAIVGLPAGLVVFFGLLRWPGRKWRVNQLLDDWIFARDYLFGRRSDIDSRLDLFARRSSSDRANSARMKS